ncbi:LacI family DNA-binding transcriptional regulator [Breznakiella homolactica]|uniref:LacI family DNA-binding transcriptional regulator n=1 Tax=Breznakiella homolactica TaxID=2798577 RepID=A0A7T8BA07_9SPIR|nr:LacI family DNA-binding transcriptional regulator [Breznakiella homolactica]QQO08480.1 LacI family transcriptional regulator [Breznakiella homolactica]
MANIKDIAKAANVSVTTVSNVLNGKANVGPETREKILSLCREMDYHPNIMARNLKSGKTNTAMFCFSDFERSFYLKIINGINDCLHEHHIGMIICTHSAINSFLRNGFVDGAIVLDKSINDRQILDAASQDMNLVVMDRILDSPKVSSVVTDNRASMEELTKRLVQKGYRRFNYLGGIENTPDHVERYEAFKAVLKTNRIAFTPDNYYQGDYSVQSGIRAGNIMAMGGNLPDVVVCANDNMAAGVVQAFREFDVDVPKRVAVSGFDGDHMSELPDGYLTTAAIPRYEMGYLAAETLVKMMNEGMPAMERKIKAPVVWGRSTR